MAAPHSITIGTRGSNLARKQTEFVAAALKQRNPALVIDVTVISTKGDRNMEPIPLDTIGKTWFTAEIEQALLSREIDLAVHSLKDLAPEIPVGLRRAAVLERADPRDVLISQRGVRFADLPHGATVGTDSIRRTALLLHKRPDLNVISVRGNVETRLRKLEEGPYDAIVLAAAGLERLGRLDAVSDYFDASDFIPAAGQGVMAAEALIENHELWALLDDIQDNHTIAATRAEQAFLGVVGGGCKVPVGCYAAINGSTVHLSGMIGSDDAQVVVRDAVTGSLAEAEALAERLARKLLGEIKRS